MIFPSVFRGNPEFGMCEVVHYAWISEGDIEVYVADITEDADEKAIRDQLYAMGIGWS